MNDSPKVIASFGRIKRWLSAHAPETASQVQPGLDVRELDDALNAMSLRALPDDYVTLLKLANGGLTALDANGSDLLSLPSVLAQWRMSFQMLDDPNIPAEARAVGPVRAVWYHRAWIPIVDDGGTQSLVIDLDPMPGGAVGQVVRTFVADSRREVVAASVGDLLDRFATELEAGHFEEEDGLLTRVNGAAAGFAAGASSVEAAAAAQRSSGVSSATYVADLPTGDGSSLVAGDRVVANLVAWDGAGMTLTHGASKLHVPFNEIAWPGNVFGPDSAVASVGDPVDVLLVGFDAASREWRCSIRQLQPDRDPLRDSAAFAVGTEHVARVRFIESSRVGFELVPSGLQAELNAPGGHGLQQLSEGAVARVRVERVDRQNRSIGVQLVWSR